MIVTCGEWIIFGRVNHITTSSAFHWFAWMFSAQFWGSSSVFLFPPNPYLPLCHHGQSFQHVSRYSCKKSNSCENMCTPSGWTGSCPLSFTRPPQRRSIRLLCFKQVWTETFSADRQSCMLLKLCTEGVSCIKTPVFYLGVLASSAGNAKHH